MVECLREKLSNDSNQTVLVSPYYSTLTLSFISLVSLLLSLSLSLSLFLSSQKALFVVEGLARSDVPDILSYLDLLLDELNQLSSSTNASIKAKSIKVSFILILYIIITKNTYLQLFYCSTFY